MVHWKVMRCYCRNNYFKLLSDCTSNTFFRLTTRRKLTHYTGNINSKTPTTTSLRLIKYKYFATAQVFRNISNLVFIEGREDSILSNTRISLQLCSKCNSQHELGDNGQWSSCYVEITSVIHLELMQFFLVNTSYDFNTAIICWRGNVVRESVEHIKMAALIKMISHFNHCVVHL